MTNVHGGVAGAIVRTKNQHQTKTVHIFARHSHNISVRYRTVPSRQQFQRQGSTLLFSDAMTCAATFGPSRCFQTSTSIRHRCRTATYSTVPLPTHLPYYTRTEESKVQSTRKNVPSAASGPLCPMWPSFCSQLSSSPQTGRAQGSECCSISTNALSKSRRPERMERNVSGLDKCICFGKQSEGF